MAIVTPRPLLATDCVVLLHGLGRTSASMSKIEAALRNAGYAVWNQSYRSTKSDIMTLGNEAVEPAASYCQQYETLHFVSHSLGGILVRAYLQEKPFDGRIVMISPPNRGSEIPDVLRELRLFQILLGPAAQELGTEPASVPNTLGKIEGQIGVITGDSSADPFFSWLIPGPDDGKVSVESAKLEEMTDFLVVPYGHTFIMQKKSVVEQVVWFLDNGRFRRF